MAVPDDIEAFATAIGPGPDDVLAEMQRRAEREGFPTVGPDVGGWFQQLAGLVGAERVFEFGSGFGYSAYWFCRGLAADGEIVLTEIDRGELEDAREYLDRGGYADRARFEHGDAIETVDAYGGPFEIVLIDNEKERYVEAFEAVETKVPVGGVVVADNVLEGPFDFETIRELVLGDDEGRAAGEDDPYADSARGVGRYLDHIGSTAAFETTLLPLGEGLAVSRRIQ
jgi:predicted O-methyltransferase YrrM